MHSLSEASSLPRKHDVLASMSSINAGQKISNLCAWPRNGLMFLKCSKCGIQETLQHVCCAKYDSLNSANGTQVEQDGCVARAQMEIVSVMRCVGGTQMGLGRRMELRRDGGAALVTFSRAITLDIAIVVTPMQMIT